MPATISSARNIWLIRHGSRQDACDPNWLATAPRRHDPPLSARGVQQARETGVFLESQKINHIFASPFLRATQTASLINERLGLPLKIEPGLSEALLTEWFPYSPDFLPLEELERLFPGIDRSYQSKVGLSHPETWETMLGRTARAIRRLLRHGGNLALVGHGGSMWGLCQELVKGNPVIHVPTCCLIKLACSPDAPGGRDEWIIEKDGSDLSHLSCPDPIPVIPGEKRSC
ncbi:MAG: histidine phosphatase family protein [Lentisphaerae bacterium]|nr:histidine phosphatase family protein [Lentisphaerota bacterium]